MRMLYNKYTSITPVVTSTYEKAPGRLEKSKHYINQAFDTRITSIPEKLRDTTIKNIVRDANNILGIDYDVVQKSNHIHWEYDPKNKKVIV